MKIDNRIMTYEIQKQASSSVQQIADKAADHAVKPDTGRPEDQIQANGDTVVHLSPELKETQLARETMAAEPDVRSEKVAALKQKIEAGEYEPDLNAVAGKMVDRFIEDLNL